jgi:hypothetical protein
MDQKITLVIGDFGLGHVQRQVLHWASVSYSSVPLNVQWASDLPLDISNSWQVKPEVGLPLSAKLWVLQRNIPTPTIYLDGNLILQGDLSQLFQDKLNFEMLVPQRLPIKLLQVFAIPATFKRVSSWVLPSECRNMEYSELANFANYTYISCGDSWQPRNYITDEDAKIIDCASLNNRPWYHPFAPSHDLWFHQLKQAISEGYLDQQKLQADVANQKLHPVWLNAHEKNIQNLVLKEAAKNTVYIPPEIRISRAQQEQLTANRYPPPPKIIWKVFLSNYFWEIFLPDKIDKISEKIKLRLSKLWRKK